MPAEALPLVPSGTVIGSVGRLPSGVLPIDTGDGEVLLDVSIAETTEARSRGLMGVEDLADGAGMVFLEPQPIQSGFWMKDTLIPLSIAFWDQRGRDPGDPRHGALPRGPM